MEKTKNSKYYILSNNSGLSIVEVLVGVAILAIVFGPLLKSFTTSTFVNAKAQKTQNVTSLAEGVMEDVKGKSIQELHDLAIVDSNVSFLPLDEDGNLTAGKLNKTPPYEVFYENVTATQGITYDAKVTIDTDEYSKASVDGDIHDANIRELPSINKVDSHSNAVISWEINQYDKKAIENLAAENAKSDGEETSLKSAYLSASSTAEKNINITIKDDSGMTKIVCEVEYSSGNSTDKSLKYLVYNGYFDEPASDKPGGPNIYLFYSLSENAAPGEFFKTENINIMDTTSGKRHSVYFIMQDGNDKLVSLGGSKVSLNISGSGWDDSVSYNASSVIENSSKLLKGTNTSPELDKVWFYSNLKDKNNKDGELFGSKSRTRIYYVTVDIMEHGKSEVITTLTSTMQAGKEVE